MAVTVAVLTGMVFYQARVDRSRGLSVCLEYTSTDGELADAFRTARGSAREEACECALRDASRSSLKLRLLDCMRTQFNRKFLLFKWNGYPWS